ncbi:MAG: hypothetical protein CVV41_04140 [Candidatus Riflebacteria bacterium HGW-Riflebacteria-1]|jgi:hypothetical protein|nr:MAG: hypothetical protein CVV41_04140 [Candidatus Riflebacteria bacterium HGW-Riflebacteria-1]
MQAFQTDEDPPARGNKSLPMIGCTRKIRKADKKIVVENRNTNLLLLQNYADQNGFSTKPAIMQKGKPFWLTFCNLRR